MEKIHGSSMNYRREDQNMKDEKSKQSVGKRDYRCNNLSFAVDLSHPVGQEKGDF
jgi:hypothetical protein